jgi:hypothetical protein
MLRPRASRRRWNPHRGSDCPVHIDVVLGSSNKIYEHYQECVVLMPNIGDHGGYGGGKSVPCSHTL